MEVVMIRRIPGSKATTQEIPFTTTCEVEVLGLHRWKLKRNGEIVFHIDCTISATLYPVGWDQTGGTVDTSAWQYDNISITKDKVYQIYCANGRSAYADDSSTSPITDVSYLRVAGNKYTSGFGKVVTPDWDTTLDTDALMLADDPTQYAEPGCIIIKLV